jgi:PncC family amidohydrolase
MSLAAQNAALVISHLTSRGWTLGLAESCTGGRLATSLTDVAGASAAFAGSIVAYRNETKEQLLQVDPALLAEQRTVSQACAEQMVHGAANALASDVAVSITGSCGPSLNDPSSRIGEVWMAIRWPTPSGRCVVHSFHQVFGGAREQIASQARDYALEQLVVLCRGGPDAH